MGTVPIGGQSLLEDQRQPGGDNPAAPRVVDHVDAVVLAIGPGDAEEEGQPPPEPQAPLLGELGSEDELVSLAPKITTLLLRHAVQEDLKVRPDTSRKLHARSFGHAS